jgi:hypothetical protein
LRHLFLGLVGGGTFIDSNIFALSSARQFFRSISAVLSGRGPHRSRLRASARGQTYPGSEGSQRASMSVISNSTCSGCFRRSPLVGTRGITAHFTRAVVSVRSEVECQSRWCRPPCRLSLILVLNALRLGRAPTGTGNSNCAGDADVLRAALTHGTRPIC